jgi:hypothetical protein
LGVLARFCKSKFWEISIDRLQAKFDRSILTFRIFQAIPHEFCHSSLINLQNIKTQKLTKASENNKAKGLTYVNQWVQIHNIWHSSVHFLKVPREKLGNVPIHRYKNLMTSNSDVQYKSELDRYLMEEIEKPSKNFDILNWWKVNSTKFPVLSQIARIVLAIPITTVASESAFSTRGGVLDPFQSSLAPITVEALVCTQNWLRSKPINGYDTEMVEDPESYKLESGKLLGL